MSLWHELRVGRGASRSRAILWLCRLRLARLWGVLYVPCLGPGSPCVWGTGPGPLQTIPPTPSLPDLVVETREGTPSLTAHGLAQLFQESADCGGANILTTWHDAANPMRFQFNFISRRTILLCGERIAGRGDHVEMRVPFTVVDTPQDKETR